MALACLPSIVAAQVHFPPTDQRNPIEISAQGMQRWQSGRYEVLWLQGECRVAQGQQTVTSQEAIVWLQRADENHYRPNKVVAFFERDVQVSHAAAKQHGVNLAHASRTEAGKMQAKQWLGRYYSNDDVRVNTRSQTAGEPRVLPNIYHRGKAAWLPETNTAVQPAQFTLPAPTPAQTLVGPQEVVQPQIVGPSVGQGTPLGTRRIRIRRRSSTGVQIRWFPNPQRNEWIATIGGGVNMLVEGLPDLGTLDISTDRLVIWTAGTQAPDLTGAGLQQADTPLEIYLEGNIVFRQGERVIFARSMYYNITQQYGVVLDAEMLTPVPEYQGLLRVKADVLQQVDRNNFVATKGAITTSRLGFPRYWLQSEEIAIRTGGDPVIDPVTGAVAIDPATGQPLQSGEFLATARNNFVYIGGIPVFYWPTIAADGSRSNFYIDSIKLKNDGVFGTQILLDWDLYQLLGIENAPEGTNWTLATDYLSDRGFGLGTDFTYDFLDPFGPQSRTKGELHAWGIDEHGVDNLGLGRRAVPPEKDLRGRIFGRHRTETAGGFQLTGEVGFISDRNFLEQYYETEWDQLKDQSTGLSASQLWKNQSFNLAGNYQVNDFFTETSWLPRSDHFLIGQSLLGDRLTWHAHTHAGYGRIATAETPTNPVDAGMFTLRPWEPTDGAVPGDREGVRASTRQQLELPLSVGPAKVVPYVLGEATYWGEDLTGTEDTRLLGQVGIRSSLSMWRVDPTVQRPLFNVNGIAHKITFQAEGFFAESDKDIGDLPLYDQLDDNSTEHLRHRLMSTTFPGGVPPQFDEVRYALRTGMQSNVSAQSLEIADDLALVRLGVRQRWQTKRGFPGQQRTVDLVTLDVGSSIFPRADDDNFGENMGLVNYEFRWFVGDRFSVVSDGYADFFTDGLKVVNVGTVLTKPQIGTLYAGVRNANGPIDATVLTGSVTYRMSQKWLLNAGTSFDLGPAGDIGSTLSFTRVGESFLVTLGGSVDASRGNTSLNFLIEPRFLRSSRARIAGETIPPVGAFGLE